MKTLHYAFLLLVFSGASLLVMGHTLRVTASVTPDHPAISSPDDHPIIHVWSRPFESSMLESTSRQPQSARPGHDFDSTYVRPAWGAFAVVMAVFFYVWVTSHGESWIDLIRFPS
jgi:hypothetical protein